ncbi:MAG TPA: ECF-type sigma factor [Terriglobia bacterium]|nr:ECF-type sigma factor [Terriglobia bacterium]
MTSGIHYPIMVSCLSEELHVVYGELRRIAAIHLRRSAPHPTLQPTALVHEAYLRLSGSRWKSRTHCLALASRAMRQFLIDYVRTKMAQKRGGPAVHVSLEESHVSGEAAHIDLDRILDIDRLLDRLAREDPRKASVVEMRFFGGLEFPEIAEQLKVSLITVKRDWQFCRAWLFNALRENEHA